VYGDQFATRIPIPYSFPDSHVMQRVSRVVHKGCDRRVMGEGVWRGSEGGDEKGPPQ